MPLKQYFKTVNPGVIRFPHRKTKSQVTPKPLYENEHATAFWDVPLFADTTQVKANRIDATIIDKTSKQVRVIEMNCPWLENIESKDFVKTTETRADEPIS